MWQSSGLSLNAIYNVCKFVAPAYRARYSPIKPSIFVSQIHRFCCDHVCGFGITFFLVAIINEGIAVGFFRILFEWVLFSNFSNRLSSLLNKSFFMHANILELHLCHRFCVYRTQHSLSWTTPLVISYFLLSRSFRYFCSGTGHCLCLQR
jgi:hypothetical protein